MARRGERCDHASGLVAAIDRDVETTVRLAQRRLDLVWGGAVGEDEAEIFVALGQWHGRLPARHRIGNTTHFMYRRAGGAGVSLDPETWEILSATS